MGSVLLVGCFFLYRVSRLMPRCQPTATNMETHESMPVVQSKKYVDDVGVLFCVYGNDDKFVLEALQSAQQIHTLNPRLSITIATDSTVEFPRYVRRYALSYKQIWTGGRQWFTRIFVLANSPYKLTLALDSHVTVCSTHLGSKLKSWYLSNDFDIAFNLVHAPFKPFDTHRRIVPHNFALVFRDNVATSALFKEWFLLQFRNPVGDDQVPLAKALQRTFVRSARLAENFAAAFKSVHRERFGFFPRFLWLAKGEVFMLHSYNPRSLGKFESICALLNSSERARVLWQEKHSSPVSILESDICSSTNSTSLHAYLCGEYQRNPGSPVLIGR